MTSHNRGSATGFSNDCAQELPLPQLALRIGVIAHGVTTTAADADAGDVRARDAIYEVLSEIRAFLTKREHRADYSSESPIFHLVTSLAGPNDRLVTDAWANLDNHEGIEYELTHVRPSHKSTCYTPVAPPTQYAAGATGRKLWSVELDCPFDHNNRFICTWRHRHRARRAVASFILQQSDVLIVVWPPSRHSGAGGPEESLRLALARGIPVIWINPERRGTVRILTNLHELSVPPSRPPAWKARLNNALGTIVDLPGRETPQIGDHSAPSPRQYVHELRQPLKSQSSIRSRIWKLLTSTLGRIPGPTQDHEAREVEPYISYEERADSLAIYYAGQYRGAFLLNYILAALAVMVAATGMVLPQERMLLSMVELAVIGIVLWNTYWARRNAWRMRSIDYRFLAELLRPMRYLAPLACSTPFWRMPADQKRHGSRRTWMTWLFHALNRATPPVLPTHDRSAAAKLDTPYLLDCLEGIITCWIKGQRNYHDRLEMTMVRIHRRLRNLGTILFTIALCVVIVTIALDLSLPSWANAANPWLLLIGGILPAIAASANGIRHQSECERLSDQSRNMAETLQHIEGELEELRRDHCLRTCCWSWLVAIRASALALVMIDEVSDWRMVYGAHEVRPP